MTKKESYHKDFVLYTEALELKELGFDEPCFGYFVGLGDNKENPFKLVEIQSEKEQFKYVDNAFHAPTYSQAFRWFRKKHNLNGYITSRTLKNGITVYIPCGRTIPDTTTEKGLVIDVLKYEAKKSYEDCELECLKQLIEIVKNK